MHITHNEPTIADYCRRMEANEIRVNVEYQRSNQVWPPAAKSFLIETILLGFPMPKLAHHQVTSLKTRSTVNEIIDGQQRSQAILEFYQDKLRLSPKLGLEDARNRRYSQLSPELQQAFLSYGVPVDTFTAADPEEIREMFRRMNSYNVPLNNEEKRHARYQGPFKWFINRLASAYGEPLIEMGVFSQRQVFRMADAKLFTELVLGLEKGIRTSSPKELNDLYSSHDKDFDDEDELRISIDRAMEFVISLPEIHGSSLMKPAQFYSLFLAVMHFQEPVERLTELAEPSDSTVERDDLIANLKVLEDLAEVGSDYVDDSDDDENETDEAADEDDSETQDLEPRWAVDLSDPKHFALASGEGTNTATTRSIRFRYYYNALTSAVSA